MTTSTQTQHTPGPDTIGAYALRLQAMSLAGRGSFSAALSSVLPTSGRRMASSAPGGEPRPPSFVEAEEARYRSLLRGETQAHKAFAKPGDCPACNAAEKGLAR